MRRTVAAAVAGVALVGAIGIGVASAATGNGPGGLISDALAGLVSKGTITQEQADAVEKALGDARDQARADREERRAERQAEVDALLQKTLGLTRDQVREKVQAGQTLREIAGDKADELVAGAMDLLRADLDQAVTDGRMTQEQADAMLASAQERAEAWVAGEDTGMGPGFGLGFLLGRGMERGMGPGMMDGDGGMGGRHGGRGMGPGGMGPGWGSDQDGSTGSTGSTSATSLRA